MVKYTRSWLAVLLAAAVAVPRSANADAQSPHVLEGAPLRALILLQPGTDDVLARIRGQTSDLRVELLVDTIESMPGDFGVQTRMAHALGQRRKASLVMWFTESGSTEHHFVVNIAIPDQGRLLVRDLGAIDEAGGGVGIGSALKESAALVVRAAIQAVLGGSTIGDTEESLKTQNTPETRIDEITDLPTSVEPTAVTTPGPSTGTAPGGSSDIREVTKGPPGTPAANTPDEEEWPSTRPRTSDWPWAAGVEWLSIYDGAKGDRFADCASVRAERQLQWFRALVNASACLNREIDAGNYGKFRIARQQATIGASANLLRTWFDVSLGAQVGVVAYERTTVPAPGAASPTTHVMVAVGPAMRLAVPARGSRLQGGLALGLDFVTSSMKVGYRDPAASTQDNFVQIAKLGLVQPYIALGLAFRW